MVGPSEGYLKVLKAAHQDNKLNNKLKRYTRNLFLMIPCNSTEIKVVIFKVAVLLRQQYMYIFFKSV